MTTKAQLVDAVRRASEETPYVVQETARGFDLTVDLADARWLGAIRAHGLRKVFTYEVRVDERRQQIAIVDVSSTVSWDAGGSVPSLSVEKRFARGRIYEWSWRKDLGVDLDSGRVGQVVDYSFDSHTGRSIIREVAKAQGWSERMSGEQKGAVVMAIIGGVGAVAAIVAAVVSSVVK